MLAVTGSIHPPLLANSVTVTTSVSQSCTQKPMKDHHKDSEEDEESLVESIDIHDDRKLEENLCGNTLT
uniref:Uncharacterized protein n=1 Tax=Timema monikensis TaxID=170555 RepID=A0A7R9HSJ8_9NEOP|nr:unnamed protein product [Timema monikensis]